MNNTKKLFFNVFALLINGWLFSMENNENKNELTVFFNELQIAFKYTEDVSGGRKYWQPDCTNWSTLFLQSSAVDMVSSLTNCHWDDIASALEIKYRKLQYEPYFNNSKFLERICYILYNYIRKNDIKKYNSGQSFPYPDNVVLSDRFLHLAYIFAKKAENK